jgi:hypothetical protein
MNTQITESSLDDVTHATMNALAAKGIQLGPDLAFSLNNIISDFLSEEVCINTVDDSQDKSDAKETLYFNVSITYESEQGSPVNKQDMQEYLENAINNERVNGALSNDHVSATNFSVILCEQ